jgi:hypothetical protein
VTRAGTLALAAFLSILAPPDAAANGRYPSAGLVTFDPSEPARVAVRTTFGVLVSRDRGATFDYVCESALRLGFEEDPMLAYATGGRLVVATFGGVLTSDDGCSFGSVSELEGAVVPDLARSTSDPERFVAFRLLGKGNGLYESSVLRSDDGGTSFVTFPPLDETLLPVTIDVAAREPSRVYVTVRRGAGDGYDSVLLVSDDGGETFVERLIPGTAGQRLAYIAGVHPHDAARLALRVNDVEQTVLYESRDAGETFDELFVARGRLTGFAYSPDGDEMAFGGLDEGLFGGAIDARSFERRSDVGPTCLGWNEDGLWACADSQRAGFSFGRSSDAGRTFEPLVVFAELCGRSSCGEASDVGALCRNDWRNVAPTLAATCGLDGGVPDGGVPDGGQTPSPAKSPGEGGGCSVSRAHRGSVSAALALGLWALYAARRRQGCTMATRSGRRKRIFPVSPGQPQHVLKCRRGRMSSV